MVTLQRRPVEPDVEKETLEIMADEILMKQIRQADADWLSKAEDAYVSWDTIRGV
ncbi:hypothetical protein [Candidatus Magnetobacterium casense]|uniref:Uncharacterized protein n=1 Tax=Candidatus Magnetobacterium casense TaxID=1455061 RepID=A0ABS6RZH2_9BACT|nr:hypothetical protein [Candidatus Magnetobacterium casensis]MBV6342043.1 hypothetical protein [Candidatus Magnetobacterium casensis]